MRWLRVLHHSHGLLRLLYIPGLLWLAYYEVVGKLLGHRVSSVLSLAIAIAGVFPMVYAGIRQEQIDPKRLAERAARQRAGLPLVYLDLPWRTRRRVLRLARRRRRHPDPSVAASAHEWAESVLADAPSRSRAVGEFATGIAVRAVITTVTRIALPDGGSGIAWGQRRLARRILRAG